MLKKRILVIDDEEDFTMLVKLNLEETGRYEVRTVNEARSAFSVIREFKPELILLDIMMPDVDGGEVAHLIESDSDLRNIPVVFVTAVISKGEEAAQTKLAGKHPLLAKPISLQELEDCIERTIGK